MAAVTATTRPLLLRAGDRGWLIDLDASHIPALVVTLTSEPWASLLEEIIPAAQSVLLIARRVGDMDVVADRLRKTLNQPEDSAADADGRTVIIPVRYDGPDLDTVAEDLGLSRDDVISAHSSARHRVGFFGFAPGFPYIEGLPEQLRLPRLSTPRTRVPPGLIAIAGGHTCVYPGGTPGGWHLIGTTTEVFWDINAQPPNRLAVGDHVAFEVVT